MTETTPTPATESTPPAKRRPFGQLRVNPKKATEGVWIQHPESKDSLRVRRLWCAEHIRAYEQAAQDYEAKNGVDSAKSAEGQTHCDAVAMATGLVLDWRVEGEAEQPYDKAVMTALLLDPEYVDLKTWIRVAASQRQNFQVEHVAGN